MDDDYPEHIQVDDEIFFKRLPDNIKRTPVLDSKQFHHQLFMMDGGNQDINGANVNREVELHAFLDVQKAQMDLLESSMASIKGLNFNIPKFTGDGSVSISDFLCDFDIYNQRIGYTTDRDKLTSLIFHLDGDAKRWFRTLQPNVQNDYTQFRTAIENHFQMSNFEKLNKKANLYQA